MISNTWQMHLCTSCTKNLSSRSHQAANSTRPWKREPRTGLCSTCQHHSWSLPGHHCPWRGFVLLKLRASPQWALSLFWMEPAARGLWLRQEHHLFAESSSPQGKKQQPLPTRLLKVVIPTNKQATFGWLFSWHPYKRRLWINMGIRNQYFSCFPQLRALWKSCAQIEDIRNLGSGTGFQCY